MQVFFYFLYNFYILYAKFSIFICIFIIYYLIFSASRQFIPYIIIYFFFLLAFFKNISYFKPDLFFHGTKNPRLFRYIKTVLCLFLYKRHKIIVSVNYKSILVSMARKNIRDKRLRFCHLKIILIFRP